MPDAASHTGKQVFLGEKAIADAYDEFDAAVIVCALNDAARHRANDPVLAIAAYLDQQADKCRQRGMARAFRIAADNVRAGFWRDGA